MRKVVLYQLLSLDGVAEEPGDWLFDVDAAFVDNLGRVIQEQDAVLLGRGTYDYWVDYWPTAVPAAEYVADLKQQTGADVGIHASIALAQYLLRAHWSTSYPSSSLLRSPVTVDGCSRATGICASSGCWTSIEPQRAPFSLPTAPSSEQ